MLNPQSFCLPLTLLILVTRRRCRLVHPHTPRLYDSLFRRDMIPKDFSSCASPHILYSQHNQAFASQGLCRYGFHKSLKTTACQSACNITQSQSAPQYQILAFAVRRRNPKLHIKQCYSISNNYLMFRKRYLVRHIPLILPPRFCSDWSMHLNQSSLVLDRDCHTSSTVFKPWTYQYSHAKSLENQGYQKPCQDAQTTNWNHGR